MKAASLIEQVCEATLVPLNLERIAKDHNGYYKAYVDKCWVFKFRLEEDAVGFMNEIDVDMEAGIGRSATMNVVGDRSGYLVYVVEDKYRPEIPDEPVVAENPY